MPKAYPSTRELLRFGASLVGVVVAAILFFTTARPLLADFYLISSVLGGEALGRVLVAIHDRLQG